MVLCAVGSTYTHTHTHTTISLVSELQHLRSDEYALRLRCAKDGIRFERLYPPHPHTSHTLTSAAAITATCAPPPLFGGALTATASLPATATATASHTAPPTATATAPATAVAGDGVWCGLYHLLSAGENVDACKDCAYYCFLSFVQCTVCHVPHNPVPSPSSASASASASVVSGHSKQTPIAVHDSDSDSESESESEWSSGYQSNSEQENSDTKHSDGSASSSSVCAVTIAPRTAMRMAGALPSSAPSSASASASSSAMKKAGLSQPQPQPQRMGRMGASAAPPTPNAVVAAATKELDPSALNHESVASDSGKVVSCLAHAHVSCNCPPNKLVLYYR